MFIGHDAYPHPAYHWTKMVRAGTAHRDGPHDHQLIKVLSVREFSDLGGMHIAPLEHLVKVHFSHATRCIVGVVIVVRVNDQAVQHPLHFLGDFA